MSQINVIQAERITSLLDSDGLPSVTVIESRGWHKRITPDFPSAAHIAWICDVATSAHTSTILSASINGDEVDRIENIPANAKRVMRFLVEQSYASVILAIENRLYMYKDHGDRFCIFFGNEDTVKHGLGITDAASDDNFLEWMNDAGLNEQETRSLVGIYHTYQSKK